MSNDTTLSELFAIELNNIPGVLSTCISRSGRTFTMNVIISDLIFEIVKPICSKQLEFEDNFPAWIFELKVLTPDDSQ